MSMFKILFSKSHFCSPFKLEDKPNHRTLQLSKLQKVLSIALAIIFGVATLGIGGVAAFYISTAIFKSWKQKHTPLTQENKDRIQAQKLANEAVEEVQKLFGHRRAGSMDENSNESAPRVRRLSADDILGAKYVPVDEKAKKAGYKNVIASLQAQGATRV